MQKVLEYERHAAECRQMAAEMKIPRYKKQLEDMAEGGTGSRISGAKGLSKTNPTQPNPLSRCIRSSACLAIFS